MNAPDTPVKVSISRGDDKPDDVIEGRAAMVAVVVPCKDCGNPTCDGWASGVMFRNPHLFDEEDVAMVIAAITVSFSAPALELIADRVQLFREVGYVETWGEAERDARARDVAASLPAVDS